MNTPERVLWTRGHCEFRFRAKRSDIMNGALFFVGLVVISMNLLLIPISSQIMGIRWAFRHRGEASVSGRVWFVILIIGVLILALAAYFPG